MYQFFIEENQLVGDRISILGSDVNHIKNVLRMKNGEHVRVSISDSGRSFFGTIESLLEDEVLVQVEKEDEAGTELSNKIYLFQGLPKGDKMELIIQKAVELGVYEIIPVAMKNCVVKLDDKKAASKVKRWQAISESAAKQSKRTLIPQIQMPMTWKNALEKAENVDIVLVPYENERGMDATREILQNIKRGQSIAIFVGPEGGFSPEEIEQIAPQDLFNELSVDENVASTSKVCRISLGKRILRTETAGLAILAVLMMQLEQ